MFRVFIIVNTMFISFNKSLITNQQQQQQQKKMKVKGENR